MFQVDATTDPYAVSPFNMFRLGDRVEVTNLLNGRTVTTQFADYGPLGKAVVFGEVSPALAVALGVRIQWKPGYGPVPVGGNIPVSFTVFPGTSDPGL
jgi:hypothetical protein